MGKAGRIACIFTPMALTIASFVCIVIIQLSGWSNPALNQYYFVQANFTGLSFENTSALANSTELTAALEQAKNSGKLAQIYRLHLFNYCSSNNKDNSGETCSPKDSNFVFDPVQVWGLNATGTASGATPTTTATNAVQSQINNLKANATALEDQVLGGAAVKALDAYRHVAHWMTIAYQVALWTSLATVICGLLAIFSRIGSFLTWLFAIVSSTFIFGAVITSSILYAGVTGAFLAIFKPYNVTLNMGTSALAVTWLAVAFSWAATWFWLFSICCCSGKSNPHHRGNKGGLWTAGDEAGYADRFAGTGGFRHSVRAEKPGSGSYNRLASPYVGAAAGHPGEQVPLHSYPSPQPSPYAQNQNGPWEPYRHH